MHMLTRRTQLLLDEDRYRRLERRARGTGRSVAAVIREAIDEKLEAEDREMARQEAGAWLLSQSTPSTPEPDWRTSKRDMLDAWGGPSAA
jgi:predicted DNA-binding protein